MGLERAPLHPERTSEREPDFFYVEFRRITRVVQETTPLGPTKTAWSRSKQRIACDRPGSLPFAWVVTARSEADLYCTKKSWGRQHLVAPAKRTHVPKDHQDHPLHTKLDFDKWAANLEEGPEGPTSGKITTQMRKVRLNGLPCGQLSLSP